MNFLFGFSVCYLLTFFLGSIFINSQFKTITEKLLLSILFSLWLSWVIVLIVKLNTINFNYYVLAFIISSVIIINFFKRDGYLDLNYTFQFLIYFIIFFSYFIIIIFRDYLPVFVHGDALFSFNFWAWKLYSNTFEQAASNGIPVFWPGLWSLIYKGIGSFENWIIPNISLLIIPITAIISVYSYFEKGYLKIFLLNIFFLVFLFFILSNRFLIGYMDIPVTLMTYISLSLLFIFHKSNDKKYFYLASFSVAIASISKQHSFILPFFFLTVTFYNFFYKKIKIKDFLIGNLIAFSHMFIFLFFFENTNIIEVIINILTEKYSNMSYLSEFSSYHYERTNRFIFGLEVLSNRVPIFVILTFLIISTFNFYKPHKSEISFFGSLCLIFFLIGFYFFSKYGAYDDRNGWFTITYLFFSFLCGLNGIFKLTDRKDTKIFIQFKKKITKLRYGLIINITFIFLLGSSLIFQKIVDFEYIQKKIQSSFGGTRERALTAFDFLEKNKSCSKLVTNLNILPYNYFLLPYYLNLNLENNFEERIILLHSETTMDSFVLQNKSCNKKDLWILTRPFQKEDLKKYENLISSGTLKQIDNYIYVHNK